MEFEKHKNWHKSNNSHNWKQGCEFCKKGFEEDERFIRIDIKNGIFRGDDDVFCFHNGCYEKGLKQLEAKKIL